MFYYYSPDEKYIMTVSRELNENYHVGYLALSEAEKDFYIANPSASYDEIKSQELLPPYEPTFRDRKGQKQREWSVKLDNGYLSPATGTTTSLTSSVIDGESVLLKAIALSIDVQQKAAGGLAMSVPYKLRAKDGSLIAGSTLGMAIAYVSEMAKLRSRIEKVNGDLFDAMSDTELEAIDTTFEWSEVLA